MNNTPRITETEWSLMRVPWKRAPLSAQEIIDALAEQDAWHPKTVKTLLNRLLK